VALAQLPNVAVKANWRPALLDAALSIPNIHDGLHRIYDAFGPKRFFWGTDDTSPACPAAIANA